VGTDGIITTVAGTGIQGFLLRGRKGAKIEFNLACIASNLRRIWNYLHEYNGKSTKASC